MQVVDKINRLGIHSAWLFLASTILEFQTYRSEVFPSVSDFVQNFIEGNHLSESINGQQLPFLLGFDSNIRVMVLIGIPKAMPKVFLSSLEILVCLAFFQLPEVTLFKAIFQFFLKCREEIVVEPQVEAQKDYEDAHCSPRLKPCP